MIIKGGAAGNIAFWGHHLMRDDTNETARLVEVSGLIADNLPAALREMQAIGRQSRSRGNFLYQANINPPADADLTDEQWRQAVERLERNLKLEGHQRAIVEHIKHGRRHYHVVWNRVDIDTLKVVDIKGNYAVHVQTARELEQMFGLVPTPSPRPDRKSRADELWERRVEEESGITRAQVSADLTRIWSETSTGRGFKAAVERAGYILARGDRRDFCVVDRAGKPHSLARRLQGVSVGEVRSRMADIDRYALPSVAEARARQRAKSGAALPSSGGVPRPQKVDRQMLASAKREVLRHNRSQRAHARRQSARNSTSAFRAARAMTRPPLNFAKVQRQIMRRAPTAVFRKAGVTATRPTRVTRAAIVSAASSTATTGPVRPSWAAHIDKSVFGRAQAAFDAEFAKWQMQIDAVSADQSLSPDQRASALLALRTRQGLEANGARKRIIEEEKQRARAAKRAARAHRQRAPHQPDR